VHSEIPPRLQRENVMVVGSWAAPTAVAGAHRQRNIPVTRPLLADEANPGARVCRFLGSGDFSAQPDALSSHAHVMVAA
jgi:hypothetical protein